MVNKSSSDSSSLLKSFENAFRGLRTGLIQERNIRIQVCYGFFLLFMTLCLEPGYLEGLFLFFSVVILLSAELGNSALERAVDLACPEYHDLAKQAKDLAAASVVIVAIASAFCALVILGPLASWYHLLLAGLVCRWIFANRWETRTAP